MKLCECMYTQNENGDSVCKRCRSDIYSCECPFVHNFTCDERNQQYIDEVNRLIQTFRLDRTHILVERPLKEET